MIHGVIFDLGSTLIRFQGEFSDFRGLAMQAMLDQLSSDGLRLNGRDFIERFNEMLDASFAEREASHVEITSGSLLRLALIEFGYGNISDDVVDRALESLYRFTEACWQPMENLHDVLDELQAAAYRLGLISNAGNTANVQRLIDMAGVREYFDPIVISAGVGIRKPHPRIFETVLKAWQLSANQVVMIGDTLNSDILGAQRIGMHQIWITADADHDSNRKNAGIVTPEATIVRLSDVPAVIRGLKPLASSAGS